MPIMTIITPGAPQLALITFLSEIRETRYAVLRRTTLKRTREGDGGVPPGTDQMPMATPGSN
jgi:hypothetical protein